MAELVAGAKLLRLNIRFFHFIQLNKRESQVIFERSQRLEQGIFHSLEHRLAPSICIVGCSVGLHSALVGVLQQGGGCGGRVSLSRSHSAVGTSGLRAIAGTIGSRLGIGISSGVGLSGRTSAVPSSNGAPNSSNY